MASFLRRLAVAERKGQQSPPSLAGVRDPSTGQWRKTGDAAASTETAPLDLAEVMKAVNEARDAANEARAAAVKAGAQPKTTQRQPAKAQQPPRGSAGEAWAHAAVWMIAIIAAAVVLIMGVYYYGAYVVYYGR